jgi:hypothetical protein
MGLRRLFRGIALILCVDDVRTLQETHLWASMDCYGDNVPLFTWEISSSRKVV